MKESNSRRQFLKDALILSTGITGCVALGGGFLDALDMINQAKLDGEDKMVKVKDEELIILKEEESKRLKRDQIIAISGIALLGSSFLLERNE